MNEGTNEGTKERRNEGTKERRNEATNEGTKQRTNERTNERPNDNGDFFPTVKRTATSAATAAAHSVASSFISLRLRSLCKRPTRRRRQSLKSSTHRCGGHAVIQKVTQDAVQSMKESVRALAR